MFVYAIRDKDTKKLIDSKHSGGRFYVKESFATIKATKLKQELVVFNLVETNIKTKNRIYMYTTLDDKNSKKTNKLYLKEKYVNDLISKNPLLRKVTYELVEIDSIIY